MLIAIAKLIRIEKCIFNTVSIFFPVLYLTQNLLLSVNYAIPVFSIIAAGFIINDINDIERDKINNPHRVLPKNNISINKAIVLYFIFLTFAILSIKILIPLEHVFIYLVYIVLMTNYDYLVRGYPYLKNLYVFLTALVHFSILYAITSINIIILVSLALNILCKEIYMDIRDVKGDGNTFAKLIGANKAGKISLFIQLILLLLLSVLTYQHSTFLHSAIILLILTTFITNIILWLKFNTLKLSVITNVVIIQNIIIYGLII